MAAAVNHPPSSPRAQPSATAMPPTANKSPIRRQNGFPSPAAANGHSLATANNSTGMSDANSSSGDSTQNPYSQYLGRSRTTTTGSTVTLKENAVGKSAAHNRLADDSDVEMDEAEGIVPKPSSSSIPIPRYNVDGRAATTASQTPSDISTPPDAAGPSTVSLKPSTSSSGGVRLSSMRAISSGSFNSRSSLGPNSSSQWSPSRSSEQNLFSVSSGRGSYPYSGMKPYLSTSFRTSAERSGSTQINEVQDDDDVEEDVFGHTSSSFGLSNGRSSNFSARQPSRSSAVVGSEMEGEGDMAGVFSFSSPYLRPQSVDENIPALGSSPPDRAGPPPDRVLSPSWTAKSLQQLSLGGGGGGAGGADMAPSSSQGSAAASNIGALRNDRTTRPSHHMHHHHPHSYSHTPFSRSLPSGSAQAQRITPNRMSRPMMPAASVSAYSISPSAGGAAPGAATFGNATLYSRSPSTGSPFGRSPGNAVGFAGSMRPSPYHGHAGARSGAIGNGSSPYGMDVPASHRERSTSRSRFSNVSHMASEDMYEGEEEDEEDDATDDEMHLPSQIEDDDDAGTIGRHSRSRVGISRGQAGFMPSNSVPTAAYALSAAAAAAAAQSSPARPLPHNVEVDDDGTGPAPDEMAEVAHIRDRLGGAANCAAFIAKLWFLVTRPARYGKYVHWNATGTTVILSTDPDVANEFASDVLPRLWNHANYSSFIRQMNLYGFQRLPSSRILDKAEVAVAIEKGMRGAQDGQVPSELSTAQQLYGSHSSFLHPKFVRGREDLLPMLKPRNTKKPKGAGGGGKDEDE